jgi:hypothetical protein
MSTNAQPAWAKWIGPADSFAIAARPHLPQQVQRLGARQARSARQLSPKPRRRSRATAASTAGSSSKATIAGRRSWVVTAVSLQVGRAAASLSTRALLEAGDRTARREGRPTSPRRARQTTQALRRWPPGAATRTLSAERSRRSAPASHIGLDPLEGGTPAGNHRARRRTSRAGCGEPPRPARRRRAATARRGGPPARGSPRGRRPCRGGPAPWPRCGRER